MVIGQVLAGAATQRWAAAVKSRYLYGGALTQGTSRTNGVSLTFDDGPHPVWTPRLLDCLDEHSLVCTFFVVGRSVAEHPGIVRETRRRGHELGTHLYWHRRPYAHRVDRLNEEIGRSRAELEDTLGEPVRFLRFPYADRCGLDARTIREVHGLQAVHWTFSSHDSRARSADEILRRVAPRLRSGAIVLMHDCLADDGPSLPARYHADRSVMLSSIPRIAAELVTRKLRSANVSELIERNLYVPSQQT